MTDEIRETPSSTPNFRTELAAQLADLVPEAVADGKVDVEKLKELLDGDAADSNERFGLFWPGKKRALRAAQEPTTATLRPDFENSKDWDTTQNVFIEGDNLEVLKILQKHYHAKIKIIYIDPPYNTGKDFVYPDNYKEGLDTYLEWTRQVNEEGKKLSTNAETEGRYHSNWLNMMYPRLKLARNLLADDGAIFVSIGDDELAHLRKLCDEVFGESNFVAQIAWQHLDTVKNDARYFSGNHESVLVYARRIADLKIRGIKRGEKQAAYYKNPDGDPRGPYLLTPLHAKSGSASGIYSYTFSNGQTWRPPEGTFPRFSRETLEKLDAEGRLRLDPAGVATPQRKTYLSEVGDRMPPTTFWAYREFGSTRQSNREVSELIGRGVFQNPKPTRLISALLDLVASSEDALVLDFFAGSGSTAHAVMALNAADRGARRFVLVQLPEPTPQGSDARKAGYATVAEICRERISRAGDRVKSELAGQGVDVGFRAFELVDTNFTKWRLSSDVDEGVLQQNLLALRDSAADGATADELLTEILLKQGYSLTETVSSSSVAGLDVRLVHDGDGDVAVLAYLNEHVKPTLEQLRALVEEAPARIIVLEDAFQGDDELKTNLAQLCKSSGIELWTA